MEELLSVREVVRMTGVSEKVLYDYDKRGLLKAVRTGENVANNRKKYTWKDVDRLKAIVVMKEFGFSLDEIGGILDDPDFDLDTVLGKRMRQLARKANRMRDLLLFTKFVRLAGVDFFEAMAVGPEEIDEAADYLRDTPLYCNALRRIANYSPSELAEAFTELDRIIDCMVHRSDTLGFTGIELMVGKFTQWWETYVGPFDDMGYLGFWAVFEDGSIIASEIEAIGGEAACAYVQTYVFFVWLKDLMVQVEEGVAKTAAFVDVDVAAALEEFQLVCGRVILALGLWDLLPDSDDEAADEADGEGLCVLDFAGMACHFLGYMKGVLEDDGLRAFLDPGEAIEMSPDDLDKVVAFAQLVLEDDEGAVEDEEGAGGDDGSGEDGCAYVPRRRIGAEYR